VSQGTPTEYETDTEPVYRHTPRELVYPAQWILTLIPMILTGVEAYYRKEGIDPYKSYKFGSVWRN
jgi:hypothetical protein